MVELLTTLPARGRIVETLPAPGRVGLVTDRGYRGLWFEPGAVPYYPIRVNKLEPKGTFAAGTHGPARQGPITAAYDQRLAAMQSFSHVLLIHWLSHCCVISQ